MKHSPEQPYSIPARYRKMENMHIVCWLLKDISWCMIWKSLAIGMVVPTITIAVIIVWRTRKIAAELAHNLAVAFWIAANSLWMISEFFHFDTMVIGSGFTGKHLALIPFGCGVLILLWYYIFQRQKDLDQQQPVTL